MRLSFSVVLVGVLFVGCSTHPVDPKIEMKPPVYVEQLPAATKQQAVSNPGSLFGQGDNPLFADLKAMNPNDIVTVVISETIAQSSVGQKTISENNSDKLGAGVLTGFGGTVGTAISDKAGKIGFEASSTNSYNGSGKNSRNESFTTTISARIIKILKNGNYFIEGNRELLVNGEKQVIQISGVIRPYDIDQKNTIDSKYIADAKILYKTEGEIDRATEKPWGSKYVESLWPF
jgi:flagellar L-ring protein precursor FlgH